MGFVNGQLVRGKCTAAHDKQSCIQNYERRATAVLHDSSGSAGAPDAPAGRLTAEPAGARHPGSGERQSSKTPGQPRPELREILCDR